jgi:hypothetical protein
MNAKRFIIATAAAITILALVIGWKSVRAARAAESVVAVIARNRVNAEKDLRQEAARLAAAEKDRSVLQSQLDELQKPRRTEKVAPLPPTVALNDVERVVKASLEKSAQREEDPKVQNLSFASMRVSLASKYAYLFRELGLSSAQSEKFLDITLKRVEQGVDLGAAVRAQGMSVDDPVVDKLGLQMRQECEAAQRELLGEAGFRQLQDYERTADMRELVRSTAGAATVADGPFTPQQAEQLIQVLANASSTYRSGGKASVQNTDWDAVEAPARAILSGGQYSFLQLSSRRLSRQADDLIGQARKAEAASAAAPAAKAPGG